VGLVATCISLLAPAAKGETLADAIALAYQSNPTLQAARAQLRATDESYVQARAGFGPTIELQAEPSYQRAQQTNIFGQSSDQESNSGAAALEVSQPLFTSGAVTWSVDAASEQIRAARQGLRTTEAQVLLGVVQAYVDVRRDQRIVAIYEGEVGILQNQLDDIRARQKAGDVTRTDVEQSQTQLDSARAALTLAEGQLQISRAEYVAVVGQNPGTLAPEPPLPGLPQTIDEAFQAVEANNGSLLQAEATEQSDAAKIEEARAQYRPSVQLSASYGYSGPLAPFAVKSEQRGISAGALVTIPLFTAGIAESNVRKAIETEAADRLGIEAARRAAVQSAANAWNTAVAARASATADEHAVAAARRYFYDTEQEYRVGQRSTLDVLIAEQTLRAAEISAAQAEHDAYVAQAALLAACGRLEAANMVAGLPLYDPSVSFRKVEHKGEAPWEDLVAALDRVGVALFPAPRPAPLSAPPIASEPSLRSGDQLPADAPLATALPTSPTPAATSPATPPGLGADRGAPYTPAK